MTALHGPVGVRRTSIPNGETDVAQIWAFSGSMGVVSQHLYRLAGLVRYGKRGDEKH